MDLRPARWIVAAVAAMVLVQAESALASDQWTPSEWVAEDTLELGTTAPGEDLYWFKVWLVVIDGDVYVRLGGTASGRFEESTTRPYLGVRIAGKEFARVEGVPEPDKAEQVGKLMAEKYWTDIFVRWMDHPLTLRLRPE